MPQEFYASEIVSPKPGSSSGLLRLRPGRLLLGKRGEILSVSRVKPAVWRKLPTRKKLGCIIPGLVDPHTHLIFGGQRAAEWAKRLAGLSYQQIYREGGGIQKTVRETRKLSEAQLIKIGLKRAEAFLAQGVTTLEAKTGYGLDFESEFHHLKALTRIKKKSPLQIFRTFMGAHALAPEFKSSKAFVQEIIAHWLPRLKSQADFQDVFVERAYFGKQEAIQLLEEGKKYGLRPKVHAHEFGRTGGVEVACKVGAVSADHLQYMSDGDWKALRQARVVPVVLPGTSFFLGGKKYADARRAWDLGLPVAIASDFNPGTNPSWNVALCGSLAAMKEGLTLEEVLVAQTKNAALALGLNDRAILAKGYRADFVVLDAESFEEFYYHYGCPLVRAVFVQGKKVFSR